MNEANSMGSRLAVNKVTRYKQGAPSFPTLIFMNREWKIQDLLAQQIFQSKRYTTYECIPELILSVPAARSTIVKKIKPLVYLHIFTNITTVQQEFICCSWSPAASVKITWQYDHFHDFSWLSMTFAIFHDFPGLENGLPKFHDFPWPEGTLYKAKANDRLITTISAIWSKFRSQCKPQSLNEK